MQYFCYIHIHFYIGKAYFIQARLIFLDEKYEEKTHP